MLEATRQRYDAYIRSGLMRASATDLRKAYPPAKASLTLCVLTLQFTPIEHRAAIMQRIADHTIPGGALILVEKVTSRWADLDARLVEVYYDFKARNGYSQDEIERKRLSLEGVLVPVSAAWNEDLMHAAGFRAVEGFWRWANFAGWLAVK